MITDLVKRAWTKHKEKSANNNISGIRSDFRVCEKNGKIYLLHNGYAFAAMQKDATATEIAEKLNAARDVAVEFEGLWK